MKSVEFIRNLMMFEKHNTVKKPFSFILLVLAIGSLTVGHSQVWKPMGNNPNNQISIYNANYNSMAIDANGIPYVGFKDQNLNGKLTVKKFISSSWVNVGIPGFSLGEVDYPNIALSRTGTPYVVYQDVANYKRIAVKRFNGTNWVNVGIPDFTGGLVQYTSITVDKNGEPYVAFADYTASGKLTVMKFDGTSWVLVGSKAFSSDNAYTISIKIAPTGEPYVSFRDRGNGYKATVMKFNGINWIGVGNPGFSQYDAGSISLAFDTAGVPYVGYEGYSMVTYTGHVAVKRFNGTSWVNVSGSPIATGNFHMASIAIDTNTNTLYLAHSSSTSGNLGAGVLKFDGSSWVNVGKTNFTMGGPFDGMIALDKSGTPFFLFKTNFNSNKAMLMRFDGSDWQILGDAGVAQGVVDRTSMVVNKSGTTYIAFVDRKYGNSVSVMKYNGSGWVAVGKRAFSAGEAGFPKLALSSKGTPYVVYSDYSTLNEKATVMKFDGQNWVLVGVKGFSAGRVDYTSIAIDSAGSPYVTFQDYGAGGNFRTLRFNGTNWVHLSGNGYSAISSQEVSMATYNGEPYVAYVDVQQNANISVSKYDGTNWITVGTKGFSPGYSNQPSLYIDSTGTPYVVFQDFMNGRKATAMKFNGTNWVLIGTAGFTAGIANHLDIKLDKNGDPIVVFQDDQNRGKATVMKFNGSVWSTVGSAGFSSGGTYYCQIGIDEKNQPIISFLDGGAWVYKFTNDCVPSASTMITASCNSYVSPSGKMIWNNSGTYMDTLIDRNMCDSVITVQLKINAATKVWDTVQDCNSYTWPINNKIYSSSALDTVILKSAFGCDSTVILNITIGVDTTVRQSGFALFANAYGATYQWLDCNDSYSLIAGATSRSFTPIKDGSYAAQISYNSCTDTSSCLLIQGIGMDPFEVPGIKIYPNPSNGKVTMDLSSGQEIKLSLYDTAGKQLMNWQNIKGKFTFDVSAYPSGVYYIKGGTEEFSISEMLIKE